MTATGAAFTGQVADLLFLQPGAVEYRYPGQSASATDAADALVAAERLWLALRPLL